MSVLKGAGVLGKVVCRGLAWDKPQAGPRQETARCGCGALDLLLEQPGFV